MTGLLGINHQTRSTTNVDRLVAFYTDLLGATLAFERPASPTTPRVAALNVGGADHLMLVNAATAAS